MKKEEENNNMNEEVLFRYFAGQLNSDQNAAVVSWSNESRENGLEFERVRIFYLDTKALANLDSFEKEYDVISAWKNVKGKNEIREKVKSPNPYLKLVASFLLLMMLGYLMYDHYLNVDEVILTAIEEPVNMELSDGSVVTLNNGTVLKYPEKFRGNTREVELSGEAYFEVEASKEKPFVILVDGLMVKAVGTAFNVKSVVNSDSIFVSVDEGIVQMLYGKEMFELTEGEMGMFIKESSSLKASTKEKIATHNYWRTKQLNFYGNSINEVIHSIEKIYQVFVTLDNDKIGNCRITVSFDNENVENVLEIIAATLDLEVSLHNNTYLLSGEGCDP
ncbi:MAG: FecR domain-containing protein [Reichenbachiella sp.]